MESIWAGDAESAFFSSEIFDKYRVLNQPEYESSGRAKNGHYILGIDVGRLGCTTEVVVIKETPQAQGASIKSVVNIFSMEAEDFETQAINIKKLYYRYHAEQMAIDANGLGIGFVDFMTKKQIDPETGDELPAFGVSGGTSDEYVEQYRKIKGPGVEEDAMFLIKANAVINNEAYVYTQAQLINGKIKFLIDEVAAKSKLMATKYGANMDADRRAEALKPFVLTTALKESMMNLKEEHQGVNIILKQATKAIAKDKFSALIYGLLYIKRQEDNRKKKKKYSISDMLFFSPN